jgi:hypothetical protein
MSSPSAISCWTAMMSARGTMTSTTRRSRRPRMFCSMTLSLGEKPVSPAPALRTSVRLARMEPALNPNSTRNAHPNQPSRRSCRTKLVDGSGTGRLRASLAGPSGSGELEGSCSGMGLSNQASGSRVM